MSSSLNILIIFSLATVALSRKSRFNFMKHMPEMAAMEISGDCIVTGNQLFANALFVRALTTTEQAEVQQYQTQLQQFQQQFRQITDQLRNLSQTENPTPSPMGGKSGKGKGGKAGRGNRGQNFATPSPQAQALIDELKNLTGPSAPSFCNGSDTILYVFPGCAVQNFKVYVGRTYVRNLTDAEVQQLNTFIQQANALEQWEIEQMGQMGQNMGGHQGGNMGGIGGPGHNNGGHHGQSAAAPSMSTNNNSSSPSSPSSPSSASSPSSPSTLSPSTTSSISSKPVFPTVPQFCTMF